MKKLLLLLLLVGCNQVKKPFVITGKFINCYKENEALYYYQDANGRKREFIETNTKYSLGDTIK